MSLGIDYFLSKQRLYIHLSLNKYICNDLIKIIVDMIDRNYKYKEKLCSEIRFIVCLNKRNIYTSSWTILNRCFPLKKGVVNIIKERSKYYYNGGGHLPFLMEHDQKCECEQCVNQFDYPRTLYLIKQNNEKIYGPNSKLSNEWFFFLYYLLMTKSISNHLENVSLKSQTYGFSSIYDHINNRKRTNFINPLITKKEDCIKLNRIWMKHINIR